MSSLLSHFIADWNIEKANHPPASDDRVFSQELRDDGFRDLILAKPIARVISRAPNSAPWNQTN
jgi:hypothetical protein